MLVPCVSESMSSPIATAFLGQGLRSHREYLLAFTELRSCAVFWINILGPNTAAVWLESVR